MLYLYALALGLPPRSGLRGIDGEPLQRFAAGEVIAVAGELARAPEPSEDALRVQDQVVRALHEKAEGLLPARFGTLHDRPDALMAALWRDRERLEKALREVAGMEQMTLRVFADERRLGADEASSAMRGLVEATPGGGPARSSTPGAIEASLPDLARTVQIDVGAAAAALEGRGNSNRAASSTRAGSEQGTESPGAGTAYLERIRARVSSAPGLEAIHGAVGALTRGERVVPATTAPLRATVYHLVPRGSAERYLSAIDSAALPPGVRLAASGPFPAYAFAPELST